ncbi:hypothetical protein PENTCL1PPCAC_26821, partial [Pristionchus entomophagus]
RFFPFPSNEMPNLFRTILDSIIGRRSIGECNKGVPPISEMSPSQGTPDREINTPTLTNSEPETIYHIPRVFDILNGEWISIKLTDARLCGYGVFSNVYYGKLMEPEEMEVAIKKVWPKKTKRNDEMLLLASFRKLGARNVAQLLYTGRSTHSEGTRNSLICETFYMTYQESNLEQLIRSEGALELVETKLYAWQIFNGLDFLAMNNIMHRDVKPVNILVNRATGELQLADFGSAKLVKNAKELSTGYQVTRYYRPPELLYSKGMMVYDWRVDLWSAGCVVAEMLTGKILFASRNVKHQRTRTQYALGVPSEKDIELMGVPEEVVVESIDLNIRSIGIKRFLRDYSIPSEAIRFLSKLFVYNPRKRPHGEKAMGDSFFEEILDSSTLTSTGLSTSPLLLRQSGPAKRPYDFEAMFTLNRRADTPVIPTPAESSPSDPSYSDRQVLRVSPLDRAVKDSPEDALTPVVM